MNDKWIYDEEIYPNLFLLNAKIPNTDTRVSFEVSPFKDNRQEMLSWIKVLTEMIGYNSLYFDYPVLEYVLKHLFHLRGRELTFRAHKFAEALIKGRRFVNTKNHFRKQTDLFKINHFDNQAKSTSLKVLEFNLEMLSIQDLPYPPGTILTEEEIYNTVLYCDNDVDATEMVYNETLPDIELREKMSPIYGIDFTNFNSVKMGEHILISKIADKLGESVLYDIQETDRGTRKKPRITKRSEINFNEVVFDYIEFESEPFRKILEWFKSRTITEIKGVFSNIPLEELEIIDGHYATSKVGWSDAKEMMVVKPLINTKKELKTLNIENFGFQYDFGVGGIHGSALSGVYTPADDEFMEDIDVASYYPNLGIQNRFYPEHLGPEFCDIYAGIYEERKLYPKKTHKAENLALKLALNGSYGKSNSPYSPLCDPMYTMKTTVNGQLLLCMLSEQLMTRIPGSEMIQINTDGMTIKYKKIYKNLMDSICREWEQATRLELEHAFYSSMVIKDVNNYIAVSVDGWIKRKGAAFIYKKAPGEMELHKNFSQLIIPKALEAYFTEGIVPEDFIQNHDNVFDFFKRTKIQKNHNLLMTDLDINGNVIKDTEIQRVTRYLISGELIEREKQFHPVGVGKTLIKKMPPIESKVQKQVTEATSVKELRQIRESLVRRNNVEAGYLCTVANNITDTQAIRNLVYYPYYIREVYKVIKQIEYEQRQ